jgi:hypothetical protein
MIDKTKEYTYLDGPVRIYADGSDTHRGYIHGAFFRSDGTWEDFELADETMLKEVWQPKEGELCYFWDDDDGIVIIGIFSSLRKIHNKTTEYISNKYGDWDNCCSIKQLPPHIQKLLDEQEK